MSTSEQEPRFVPGQGFSLESWNEVRDHPELTDNQIAGLKPIEPVLPGVAAAARRRRGPQKAQTKELISLRVDRRVLEHFRATGQGWQSRMNAALAKAAGLHE